MNNETNPDTEKRISRWACLPVGLIMLVLFILPILGCRLIANGQIEWGNPNGRQVRIFLLQDVDQEGIGIQRSRVRDQAGGCIETAVTYWMWTGEAENRSTCQCSGDPASPPAGCEVP